MVSNSHFFNCHWKTITWCSCAHIKITCVPIICLRSTPFPNSLPVSLFHRIVLGVSGLAFAGKWFHMKCDALGPPSSSAAAAGVTSWHSPIPHWAHLWAAKDPRTKQIAPPLPSNHPSISSSSSLILPLLLVSTWIFCPFVLSRQRPESRALGELGREWKREKIGKINS